MEKLDHLLARRHGSIKGAGLGLVAGGLASSLPAQKHERGGCRGRRDLEQRILGQGRAIFRCGFYRKRVGAPKAGEPFAAGRVLCPRFVGDFEGIRSQGAWSRRIFGDGTSLPAMGSTAGPWIMKTTAKSGAHFRQFRYRQRR